ncbi:MAG TPA: prefoldin subunit alpha [Candidatus Nanoarchaeia archaeon]|nr:prefoldin subunit alpha [Candidatus Nanoarchaeia archaeon]
METSEYLMELQLLEQQAGHFEEQLQVIDQQIEELKMLKKNLIDFQSSKETEVFSEFGKGIYFKSSIKDKELLVDVGAKVLIPKTFDNVREIIEDQINKFEGIKPEIASNIQQINLKLDEIVSNAKIDRENEGKKSEGKNTKKPDKNDLKSIKKTK